MAVAALSNAALALTGNVSPQPASPSPAAGSSPESAQNFAKLVSRQSEQKNASDGEQAQPETKLPSDPTVGATDEPAASTDSELSADSETGEKPDTLLADIEAMVAAAAQLGTSQPIVPVLVAQPVPTAPVNDATTTTSAAVDQTAIIGTITGTESRATDTGTPETTGMPTGLPDIGAPLPASTGPTAPVQTTSGRTPEAGGSVEAHEPAAVLPTGSATAPTGTASLQQQATPELTHIASLIASLRQAFAPASQATAGSTSKSDAGTTPNVSMPQAVPTTVVEAAAATMAPLATSPSPIVAEAEGEEGKSIEPTITDSSEPVDAPVVRTTSAAKKEVAEAVQPTRLAPQAAGNEPTSGVSSDDGALATADDAPAPVTTDGSAQGVEPTAADSSGAPTAAAPVPTPPAPTSSTATDSGAVQTGATVADASAAQQQTIDRHLDLARDTQWLDRLARDISRAADHQGHLKFQLNPEHLGALTVEIANSAAGTAIRMSADTDQARQIIADAQPRLIAEVRAQGLRVAESHVDLNNQQSGGGTGSTGAQAQQGQQGQSRQPSEDNKPFSPNQSAVRDEAVDSTERDDRDLYA